MKQKDFKKFINKPLYVIGNKKEENDVSKIATTMRCESLKSFSVSRGLTVAKQHPFRKTKEV